ncbi:MAG: hypothetical protein ACOCWK_06440, partial [Tangfeifania sp.]
MKHLITLIVLFFNIHSLAQETNMVILNKKEVKNFRKILNTVPEAKSMYDSIYNEALHLLDHEPRPMEVVYYEGLLDTNPKRVKTMKSF